MDARQFIAELKTRGVYRVAAFYCAGAWALLQIADLFSPVVGLPDESVTIVLLASAAGFPLALLLAWWFDWTPQGVVVTPSPEVTARLPRNPPHLLEIAVILLLIVSVGYLYVDRLNSEPEPARRGASLAIDARPSIAVMPFLNLSRNEDTQYLGDGLAEEVLNLLARLSELNVASRTASFYYRDREQNPDLKAVAAALGVGHILEGSVRRDGQRVRVAVQLVDAGSGFQLWSNTYEREFGGLLALQEDIARKVVKSLQVVLSERSARRLSQQDHIDAAAYDFYLRGRSLLNRQLDETNLAAALAMFRRALEIAPDFASAWAGLCDVQLGRYEQTLSRDNFREADQSCQRALALDSNAIPVYVAQGNLYRISGRYTESLTAFSRGLALSPTVVEAYLGRGKTQAAIGQRELAVADFEKAIRLQPNFWRAYNDLGTFYFEAGDFARALPYLEKVASFNPDSDTVFNNLGSTYYMLGRVEDASRAWARAAGLAPSPEALSNLGTALFFRGLFRDAAERYRDAIAMSPDNFQYWGNLGEALRFVDGSDDERGRAFGRAVELAEAALEVNPRNVLLQSMLAGYYAQSGNLNEARIYLPDGPINGERRDTDYNVLYYRAMTYVLLEDHNNALDAVAEMVAKGYPSRLLAMDANFGELRQEPRFKHLLLAIDRVDEG
ncbi:MAG: tetratricopeptide repeat protein [Parahaliea sp.]